MGTAPSFGSLELIQAGVDDQPLLLATGDGLHKAPYPSIEIRETDASEVPICPPGETHVPVSTEAAPNHAACFAHAQPPVDTLTATSVAPQSAAAPARQQPPVGAQAQPVCQASTDAQPVFTPASQAPAFCLAPQPGPAVFAQAGGQPSTAPMYTRTASQHNWASVPQPVSYTAAVPGMVPMGWQMPTWMTYIPASLQPHRGNTDQAAVERSQRQLARFHAKKQLLSCRKTVRYASRKIYADSRPRVHGRFIRKTDPAANLATTGA